MTLAFRIARMLVIGVLGAARWLAFLALMLALVFPLSRTAMQWYAQGRLRPLPEASSRAASGPGPEITTMGMTAEQRARIRAALRELRYRLPPRSVTFVLGGVPQSRLYDGAYSPALDLIRLESRVLEAGGVELRRAVAHEVGHYADQHHMDKRRRLAFMRLREIPRSRYWRSQDAPWEVRPDEDFAEVFAMLAIPSPVVPPRTVYGPLRQADDAEALMREAGIRFDGVTAPRDWRTAVRWEYNFFEDVMSYPSVSFAFWLTVIAYGAAGASRGMRREWRR